MGNGVLPLVLVAMVPIIVGTIGQRALGEKSLANIDYPDYSSNYDNYPIVVPKRAALLLDQLMVALQKVVDNQGRGGELEGSAVGRSYGRPGGSAGVQGSLPNSPQVPSADEQTMDLQRRGQAKGRVYWRCYFNAVTCFKRK